MGGPWNIPTGSQYIRCDDWGHHIRVEYAYGEGWPSRSVLKFYWEQDA